MKFHLESPFEATGDQPEAIRQLVEGLTHDQKFQTLLGVTGSGKTFSIANVITQTQRPTLVLSHNKTLAAQLYSEFKAFFPENLVEYFVSYYDYYQPEAYLPSSNTYIEKDLSINDEIEKLRLSATSALLSGRRDVIVIASISCIYGMGNPEEFYKNIVHVKKGQSIPRNQFLHQLVTALYSRTQAEFSRGTFRVTGDTVDIYLANADSAIRILFWGDEIESIRSFDPESGQGTADFEDINIFPANLFVTGKDLLNESIWEIQQDLKAQVDFFKANGKHQEAKRLEERVSFDLEMMKELGYCSGIENYSRYFDRRKAGMRPFCLLDYFPDDWLLVVDESHVTVPQIGAMYGGDRSRKTNLVEYGFRLPSAMDNRPLTFDEFDSLINQAIFVSATPADFELDRSEGIVVEQVIRPTGLLDPPIEVRPTTHQIDDLIEEIQKTIQAGERILVTTLTKRMAEELTKYFERLRIKTRYIHSDVDTLERVEILRDLRAGVFDVLVGVNLLREGLDLPEVSLVAIMDADKEGFLRNRRSLTQTAGRAARNVNGRVLMYADKTTKSMQQTIDETNRRREKQKAYNKKHGLKPETIVKARFNILEQSDVLDERIKAYPEGDTNNIASGVAADPVVQFMNKSQLQKLAEETEKRMKKAAKALEFMEAAQLRDEYFELLRQIKTKR